MSQIEEILWIDVQILKNQYKNLPEYKNLSVLPYLHRVC